VNCDGLFALAKIKLLEHIMLSLDNKEKMHPNRGLIGISTGKLIEGRTTSVLTGAMHFKL